MGTYITSSSWTSITSPIILLLVVEDMRQKETERHVLLIRYSFFIFLHLLDQERGKARRSTSLYHRLEALEEIVEEEEARLLAHKHSQHYN